ncbi:MAG: hypothetical protein HY749_04850 [Gammaproteobacteria bacterium]|nr:hypothetical protein [Gammaproteobacteria bacterium]MBI5617664.1 hypothetical protein [Gammaproteobacteria bacterium]
MATICICWEYGTGYGHVLRYRELVAKLRGEGHRVVYVARAPQRAAAVFGADAPEILAAPLGETPPARRIRLPYTFAEILLNCGFDDGAALAVRTRAWRDLLRARAPDAIFSDFSPSALMAGRALGVPTIVCGSGFYSPPLLRPVPPLRYWLPHDRARQLEAEDRVVANMNEALAGIDAAPLAALADLYAAPQVLMTVPEFDPYPERPGVLHAGTYADAAFGAAPRWPAGAGPAVFAYLEPGILLDEILAGLSGIGARVCLFSPGLDRGALGARSRLPALELMSEPVDVPRAAAESALMITNANLNTLVSGLKAGTPQLAVPYNLEKFLTARRLEEYGAGLAAPRLAPGDIPGKIAALLAAPAFREAAGRFAAKYAAQAGTETLHAMYDSFRRCLEPRAARIGEGH